MSATLFVGNLSRGITSNEVRDLFSSVGVVESCQLTEDRDTGHSKGFAFVEMSSKEEAKAAKERFDGHDLCGRPLNVIEALSKNKGRHSGSGRRRQS
jgi:cold-inducible RNA-binding protein